MAYEEEHAELAKIQAALRAPTCRVEFGFAFGSEGTYQTAQVYGTPEGLGKYKKVGPFMTTPANTRAALLDLLASLAKEA